jgi:hypothetical protein
MRALPLGLTVLSPCGGKRVLQFLFFSFLFFFFFYKKILNKDRNVNAHRLSFSILKFLFSLEVYIYIYNEGPTLMNYEIGNICVSDTCYIITSRVGYSTTLFNHFSLSMGEAQEAP